jgi:hypothetical protein
MPSPVSGLAGRIWRAPYLLLAAANLFWAGNFIVGRSVHGAVPPMALRSGAGSSGCF